MEPLSVAEIIARTWSSDFTLQLDKEKRRCAGIHAFLAWNPDPTLDEDQLRNIYRIVSEVAHGDSSSITQRATNAIARLREQRLMVRTDTAGIVRGGEYSLSRMGNAIAEWFGGTGRIDPSKPGSHDDQYPGGPGADKAGRRDGR